VALHGISRFYENLLRISRDHARDTWQWPDAYVELSKLVQKYKKLLVKHQETVEDLEDLKSIIANMRPEDVNRAKTQRDERIELENHIKKVLNQEK
jgi:hypothetical protein